MSNGGEPGGTGSPSRWQSAEAGGAYDADEVVTTRWVEETRRYRQPIGGWWWLALFLVPAILALMGSAFGGGGDDAGKKATTSTSSSSTTTSGSSSSGTGSTSAGTTSSSGATSSVKLASAPFAVSRTGSAVSLSAEVPDDAAKIALVDAVKAALPDTTVNGDGVTVSPGAAGPDANALAGSVKALSAVGDFALGYDLKSLMVVGKAKDDNVKSAAADAITKAWPTGANPVIDLVVGSDATATCGVLGDEIRVALAGTKITFATGSSSLAGGSTAVLDTVAKLIKGCSGVKLAVTGYTDSSGVAADNLKLSEQRAQAVADYLAKAGVDKTTMTVAGKGDADPVQKNDGPYYKANRRVEITVVK